MILWAFSLEGEPQKSSVLLSKTDISEFWWFYEHPLLKGNQFLQRKGRREGDRDRPPQKASLLLSKTDISEFWWLYEHSLLNGNAKNRQFYQSKLTSLSFDDSMSILSWRGTQKTISFTKQNWHFWVLMILWAFSLEGEPQKPLVLLCKTDISEFWWFYEHSLLKGNQLLQR